MTSLLRKMYSPLLFDLLFAAVGMVGLFGLLLSTGDHIPEIAAAADPLTKGAILIGVVLVGTIVSIFSTRLDQKCAEDFLFQTLTKSSFVGIMGFVLSMVFWQVLFARTYGRLPGFTIIGIVLTCWTLGYFYTRMRGTRA